MDNRSNGFKAIEDSLITDINSANLLRRKFIAMQSVY
jgi:hypothetical protein